MTDRSNLTALVTGASSGLGLEAAAQLAEQGYGRIIITARSDAKAESALEQLRQRVDADRFELLTLDLDNHASVLAAADTISERGGQIDFLPQDFDQRLSGAHSDLFARFPKLIDLVDGEAVLDPNLLRKRPDWTYAETPVRLTGI